MKLIDRSRLILAVLIMSLTLNGLGLGYLVKTGALRRLFMKWDLVEFPGTRADFQKELEDRYRKLPSSSAEIIFAGDSLINAGPWADFMTEVHNRGIGGDTTSGLLGRLDEIIEGKPSRVLLLIGTNDLAAAVPEAQILRNYRAILERLRRESPKTVVTVIGLLPVNLTLAFKPTQNNGQIVSVNRQLEALVGEFPGVRFLDLTSVLADSTGNLRRELTTDGIHLNIDGYLAIRQSIEEFARP